MSAFFKFSRKHGETILRDLDSHLLQTVHVQIAIEAFRAALAPKARKPWATIKKAKASKKRAKKAGTKEIRDQAMGRSDGLCECCGQGFSTFDPADMDHARGRGRVPQSLENVWMLKSSCHRRKTNGDPEEWLEKYADHAHAHGYTAEETWARTRLEFVRTRKELGEALSG